MSTLTTRFICTAQFLLVLSVPVVAQPPSYSWAMPVSGNWSDLTKWTGSPPAGGPGATDSASFSVGGGRTPFRWTAPTPHSWFK
jgi:hypothetical protein